MEVEEVEVVEEVEEALSRFLSVSSSKQSDFRDPRLLPTTYSCFKLNTA